MTETELILAIEKHTGLMIGDKNISALKYFLAGYEFAMRDCGKDFGRRQEFNKYVTDWCGVNDNHHWCSALLFVCGSEQKAFEEFISLYKSFLRGEKREPGAEATG